MKITGLNKVLGASRDVNRFALTFTRPTGTTAYDAGDIYGAAVDAAVSEANVLSLAGDGVQIVNGLLVAQIAAVPSGMTTHDLHIYNAAPTALANGETWVLNDADRAKYLGKIQFVAPTDVGGSLVSQLAAPALTVALAAGSTALYFQLVTTGAYTPEASAVIKVYLTVAGI